MSYEKLQAELRKHPRVWLITGVAGFIGSNLLEALLKLNQTVIGLDNFSTGTQRNIDEVLARACKRRDFDLIKGDICQISDCQHACVGVDYVLHHAAMGSVPASVEDHLGCNENNVTGFLKVLTAARDQQVRRVVYASSSAVYGDCEDTINVEHRVGRPMSPYAASKAADELYASVFNQTFGLDTVGLRYFNVFGPRQSPNGAYAAVIPQWIKAMQDGGPVVVNGDGSTSRDFLYVEDVVQANLLAATHSAAPNQVFNVALGSGTTLNELFALLRKKIPDFRAHPCYGHFRQGDVHHSQASISKATSLMGYSPAFTLDEGLDVTLSWTHSSAVRAPAS